MTALTSWCVNLLCFVLMFFIAIFAYVKDTGTTPNLQAIFIGRCLSYQQIVKPYPQSPVDCMQLWEQFHSSFSFKDPCTVTSSDYEPFVKSAITFLPVDKTMFWSGTYDVAHEYADVGKRFVTLEDTLLGFIMNGLTWCGQKEDPGINYKTCPSYSGCPETASTAFWGTASATFARNAKGNVTILLDGSNPGRPAYNKESYFSKFELPALVKDDIRVINIIVTHKIGQPFRETCENGSLPNLKSSIKDAGFTYTCQDNPQAIKHLLCVDDPSSSQCRFILRNHRELFVG